MKHRILELTYISKVNPCYIIILLVLKQFQQMFEAYDCATNIQFSEMVVHEIKFDDRAGMKIYTVCHPVFFLADWQLFMYRGKDNVHGAC